MTMEIGCTNIVHIPKTYAWITLGECSLDFFIKTTTFLYLSVQMYYHNYFEFDRIWLRLFFYFLIDAMSNSLCIYIYTY